MAAFLDFLHHISPAIVTVVFGGVVAQRIVASRSHKSALLDLIVTNLEQLRSDALDYWGQSLPNTDSKRKLLEAKIKADAQMIAADVTFVAEKYCWWKSSERRLKSLMDDVHDACTGGDFETKQKKAELSRYPTVVKSIHNLKKELWQKK